MNDLSPSAKHAIETIRFALHQGDESLTSGELRTYISRIYGSNVEQEIKHYFHPSTEPVSGREQTTTVKTSTQRK